MATPFNIFNAATLQHNDRDENAALNIRDKGVKDLDISGFGMQSDTKQKLAEAPALAGDRSAT